MPKFHRIETGIVKKLGLGTRATSTRAPSRSLLPAALLDPDVAVYFFDPPNLSPAAFRGGPH